ncbi:MAG: DUF86 domain-containing protein [Rhizobiales bacterium]|nr:DUF86 domain-containing protein [Hyphomicrobiales bacterium]
MSESDPHLLSSQMREAAKKALSYVEGFDKNMFLTDSRTQEAVVLNLLVIGEAAAKLANRHPDFVAGHPRLPWRQMQGMRNRIAHGYFDLDMTIVWETVRVALPELLLSLPDSGQVRKA